MSLDTSLNVNPVVTQAQNYVISTGYNPLFTNIATNKNSVFGNLMQTSDYSNDVMMSALKSAFTGQNPASQNISGQTQNQTIQLAPQTQAQDGFQNQDELLPQSQNDFNSKLLAQNSSIRKTENGNIYSASKSGKSWGTFAGIGSSLVSSLYNYSKAGKFSLKTLLIKTPVFGFAGFTLGAVADYFINKSRAKKADNQTVKV